MVVKINLTINVKENILYEVNSIYNIEIKGKIYTIEYSLNDEIDGIVFEKDKIHKVFSSIQDKHLGVVGIIPASLLGILSPLCMYGTIPIAASFSQKGMRLFSSIYDEFYTFKSSTFNV